MNEQEIAELETGLAKLEAKINALVQGRDAIREKLNAAKGGRQQESPDGILTHTFGTDADGILTHTISGNAPTGDGIPTIDFGGKGPATARGGVTMEGY